MSENNSNGPRKRRTKKQRATRNHKRVHYALRGEALNYLKKHHPELVDKLRSRVKRALGVAA